MERLPYTEILKTNINVTNIDEAVGYIDKYLEQMRGEYICISNVHTTVTAYRDEEYRKVQKHFKYAGWKTPLDCTEIKRIYTGRKSTGAGPDACDL